MSSVFISGGCKNGKSYFAQKVAQDLARESGENLYYIATMIPHDEEDHARIRRHLSEREGWGFETIEQGLDLMAIRDMDWVNMKGSFLLDSVTAIMENEMFRRIDRDGEVEYFVDENAGPRVRDDMVNFERAVRDAGGSVVFVSDGIYGDQGEYSQMTEDYRKALAGADLALAQVCDQVIEVSYGNMEYWK